MTTISSLFPPSSWELWFSATPWWHLAAQSLWHCTGRDTCSGSWPPPGCSAWSSSGEACCSVWTNSKFWPNRIPEYYSYVMFDQIEYTNNSDLIIRIIRIIRITFEGLKLGQMMPKKAQNSSVSDNVCIS